jgi:hypothetical protein
VLVHQCPTQSLFLVPNLGNPLLSGADPLV